MPRRRGGARARSGCPLSAPKRSRRSSAPSWTKCRRTTDIAEHPHRVAHRRRRRALADQGARLSRAWRRSSSTSTGLRSPSRSTRRSAQDQRHRRAQGARGLRGVGVARIDPKRRAAGRAQQDARLFDPAAVRHLLPKRFKTPIPRHQGRAFTIEVPLTDGGRPGLYGVSVWAKLRRLERARAREPAHRPRSTDPLTRSVARSSGGSRRERVDLARVAADAVSAASALAR